MTRFEQRLLADTAVLGIALTLIVVLLDRFGVIKPLEIYLDDVRARHFQFFRTKPTDRLVHLDLDDATLDAIGHWPWPNEKLAAILDELNRAGAKVVDLDIIFNEPEKPTIEEEGRPPVDHDKIFADAMQRFKLEPGRGVLVPFSVNVNEVAELDPKMQSIREAIYQPMVDDYEKNLELDEPQIQEDLKDRGIGRFDIATIIKYATPAREDAMFQRIRHELEAGHSSDPESLRETLLPQSARSGTNTEAVHTLQKILPRVLSYKDLFQFTRAIPQGVYLPHLLTQSKEQTLPIPMQAAAAAYSGFVDIWKSSDDAKIKYIPLFIIDRGRLVPQMGLSLACAELGVSVDKLVLAPDSVTIPLPTGKNIVIPVHTEVGGTHGDVGMLMDIPWWGKSNVEGDWQTMYDWPNYDQSLQHVPVVKVWDICEIGPEIEDNNRKLLEDVYVATEVSSFKEDADRFRANHPAFDDVEGWKKAAADALENLPPGTEDAEKPYLDGTLPIDSITDAKEHGLVLAIRGLHQRPKTNDAQVRSRAQLRQNLADLMKDKAVLIGMIASGTVDFVSTPLHNQCPGVVVHGAIFNAIMTNYFLTRAPQWVTVMLTLLVGLLVTFASAYFSPYRALGSAILVAAIFLFLNFLIGYDWGRMEIDAAGPVAAAGLIWGGCTLTRFIRERTEKNRITGRFRSYVDPSLVNYMLEHPEQATFEGEERELSVVFTDLAGFTAISELLKQETVKLLNLYLGLMEPVIRKNHGLVNKFLGDGVMFFFGAPEPYPGDPNLHAFAAVKTVVEMQNAMVPFNKQLAERGLPALKMRAGVSTGAMVVGDAGTPQRSDYTVLGDRVNLASRLESANKATGTLILISDRTVELLNGRYLVRPIGRLQVVGKEESVMTYEPLAPIDEATDEMRKLVKMTQTVTDAYINGQFAECVAATHELLTTFGDATQGKLCALYRRLSMEYLRMPSPNFRGQIKLESK
jgi:class 3 adenylate cyclase/CHASE2 domain-containing sensor protein